MPNVLILYSSVDGHTLTICQRLQACIETAGASASVLEITTCGEETLRAADAVIVGASIRYGHHRPCVAEFMRRHQALLQSKPNGFFSVNVVARKPAKNTPDTNPYLRKLLRQIGWRPSLLAVFAGRIDYPRCGLLDRHMIRLIMWITKGPTDLRQAFEFTDWTQVEAFGAQILVASKA
ncbi:menaquinone-dependent protoporphyrinogen IX dehydrogenase [Uliginosibacterium flavum]|uniref:Protoporphyrinogen IX dehydrogenase [quinone] n=1 Tax=Uliginosibacterium flavum TaxID=1396831 RepID=A0ABV2TG89_9RHOO